MAKSLKVSSKVFNGTWLDRAGKTWDFRVAKSTESLRVSCHQWADTPDVIEVKVIKGSGMKVNFKTFAKIEVTGTEFTIEQAQALLDEVA